MVNTLAFERAIRQVSAAVPTLFGELETAASPRNRDAEAVQAQARSAQRFERSAQQAD
jgi:hypothetical protein